MDFNNVRIKLYKIEFISENNKLFISSQNNINNAVEPEMHTKG